MRFSTIVVALTTAVVVSALPAPVPTPPHLPQELRNQIADHLDTHTSHHKEMADTGKTYGIKTMENSHKSQGAASNTAANMLRKNAGPKKK